MTKLSVGLGLGVVGIAFLVKCATPQRMPAGKVDRPVMFELGENHSLGSSVERVLKLPDLEAVKKKRISMSIVKYDDPAAPDQVALWQKRLEEFAQNGALPEEHRFIFESIEVDVERDDFQATALLLKRLDEVEEDPVLRFRKKAEVVAAFAERFQSPVRRDYEFFALPLELVNRIATHNIEVNDSAEPKVAPSSFWRPVGAGEFPSLYRGHGALVPGQLDGEICAYRGPKSGFGVHAGFKVKCLGQNLKVKFGNEIHSAPLNSRLYHRLGFNVPVIHHLRSLKVKYDRKLFLEINSRKAHRMRVHLAGVKVHEVVSDHVFDAFELIEGAYVHGEGLVATDEIKKRLVRPCVKEPCSLDPANFNDAFERDIEALVFQPSAVVEDIDAEEIGPWSFTSLDHRDRLEIRALPILGAWTGNFDLRKDNMKLVWMKKSGEVKHMIGDPGSGLGSAGGLWKTGGKVDDMDWTVSIQTSMPVPAADQPAPSVNVTGWVALERNTTFDAITYADARWMAKLIAGITEAEISEALAATGLSAAEFLLAREKLVSRQQKLIKDFKLEKEIGRKLRVINKHLNFDPAHGRVSVKLQDGREIVLENRGRRLVKGRLQSF